ncbi:Uncharacterised protein [Mycobacterium tuberculosis]|nr:Uncharacterised protein [Mycobacterium tuberculosis]
MGIGPERTAAGFVDAAGVGDVRTRGQHHRPVGVASRRDVCLGARHLVTGAAEMQGRSPPQPRIRPRDLVAEHEVHLGDASAKSIAAQCFGIPMWKLVAVNPQQGGGCGVEDDHTSLRFGDLDTGREPTTMRA